MQNKQPFNLTSCGYEAFAKRPEYFNLDGLAGVHVVIF